MPIVNLDIECDRHGSLLKKVQWMGADYRGSTFGVDIRVKRDAPGAALASLMQVAEGLDGVSFKYASGTVTSLIASGDLDSVPVGMVGSDTTEVSTFTLQLTDLNAIAPFPSDRSKDVVLYYDLRLNRSTAPKILPVVLFGGLLTIKAGVTF